jgi:ABC-type branched-subunit amino acid transport system substrate-binding protein
VTYERSGSAVAALRRLTTETQVFAIVAPVVFGQEAAFAAFADSTALPVIGPFAQHQRGSPNHGGFSFYLTAGPEEQARALVTYAQTTLALANPRIAIVSSRHGSTPAVADSIRQHCRTIGWTPTASLDLSVGAAIADVASQLQGAAIDTIFYDGDPLTLGALFKATAGSTWRPAILTTGLSVTPETLLRQREAGVNLFVAYPLLGSDLSPDALAQLQSLQAAYQIPSQHVPTQIAALVAARVLVEGLQRSGRDLSQTKFVTALASLQDYKTGLMPAISFGPNRRTGVLGAYIIAVAGANSEPVWVPLR